MNNVLLRCQHCHTCGTKLRQVLDGEEWCSRCSAYRRYRSHGWIHALADKSPCPAPHKGEFRFPSTTAGEWKDSIHDYDPGPDPCPHNDDPTACWECQGIYDEPWDPDPDYDANEFNRR